VAYVFWPTLYQDGRRLGSWPEMHTKTEATFYLDQKTEIKG